MKIYDILFGKKGCIPFFNTQEKRQMGSILAYKWASISSFSYVLLGIYIFWMSDKGFLMSYAIAGTVTLLGFVSFFFWASVKYSLQQLDVGLYSSMMYSPGFYFLAKSFPERDLLITVSFLGLSGLLTSYVWLIGVQHIRKRIFIINVLSVVFSMITCFVMIYIYDLQVSTNYFYGGVVCFFLGAYAKFSDSFHFSFKGLQRYGTALFHCLTAVSILLLFKDIH